MNNTCKREWRRSSSSSQGSSRQHASNETEMIKHHPANRVMRLRYYGVSNNQSINQPINQPINKQPIGEEMMTMVVDNTYIHTYIYKANSNSSSSGSGRSNS